MTDRVEQPSSGQPEASPQVPHAEALPEPAAMQQTVQQLRDAGFSDAQQAALTTALLRVLALWTQQATRDDVQTEVRAGEQRLAQQLEVLRQELRSAVAQQTDSRATPTRRREMPVWLLAALLALTCAGVLLLVVYRVLDW